jgi:hypothetical protein
MWKFILKWVFTTQVASNCPPPNTTELCYFEKKDTMTERFNKRSQAIYFMNRPSNKTMGFSDFKLDSVFIKVD